MKKVFVAQHPTEAHFVKGLLEREGIAAEVRGETLFGVRGATPATPDTLPTVWILDDRQLTSAEEFVAGYERGDRSPEMEGELWCCPNCGEMMEPQFTVCWKCAAAPTRIRREL